MKETGLKFHHKYIHFVRKINMISKKQKIVILQLKDIVQVTP